MTDLRPERAAAARPRPQRTLVTPRLRLRPLRPADAAEIALHCSDARVARMTTRIPHPYPPGTAEAMIERVLAAPPDEPVWALDSGGDGENGLIGMIGFTRREAGTEIGYWVAPAVWGAGYATEAVEAVRDHAAACGVGALVAQVFQDNLASATVLTRAGFAYLGEGETYGLARGGMVPTFRYRLELGAREAAR
jgi:RimJ/RimL family protein N-acetyltransferase